MVLPKKIFVLLCAFVYSASLVDSYRILGIFPFNGKSHNVMFTALMRGLAKHGHRVDDITHYPVKNAGKNYNVVVNLNGTMKSVVNSFTIEYITNSLTGDISRSIADEYGNVICELMRLDEMQKFIKNPPNDPPYDVVITEAFGSNCYMGFGHLLNVPVIAVSSAVEYPWICDFIGNDDNPAYVPNALNPSFDQSSFWDRLSNMYTFYQSIYSFQKTSEYNQTEAMRKYLKPDTPNIREVERSVALTLVNRHSVLHGTKPLAPSLIEVSALHIEESQTKLSPELQKWLDESVDGAVFFTFGSLTLIESLPEKMILDIYKSLARLAPMRVVMKIADKKKLPSGLPKNVYISPWFPQQAILSHPNIKVFITHGGLMGLQEALYFAVPVIGVPLFGDQFSNIATFVEKKIGVQVYYNNLTTASLNQALDEILKNDEYKKNAKYYSNLFKDRPMSPIDTAVFWIEYVIRNGPDALRSPAIKLKWWQLTLIDVYAFILLTILIPVCLVLFFTYNWLLRRSIKKTKKE